MCSKPLKVKAATYSHIICRLLVDDLLLLVDRTMVAIEYPTCFVLVATWLPSWSPLVATGIQLISIDIQLVSS